MGLELAKAYVSIHADQGGLGRDMKSVQSSVTAGIAKIGALAGPAIAAVVGGAGIAGMISVARESIGLAERQIQAESRLAAVLKATGGAAGFTAGELKDYASELQKSSTTGDEEILESMAILATFKNVSGDVFKRATASALDLSAAGFGSVSGATQQLAKALDDPVRGLGALRRVGVSFSAEQEKQIKNFAETNQLAKAQAILLSAVEGQVQGTAQALAETDPGRIQQLNNELGDIKEQIGNALLPLMVKWKEAQVGVFKGLLEGVKWLQVFVNNSGTVWELFKTQTMLSISGVFDFFKNLWDAIPNIAAGAFNAIGVGLSTWFDNVGATLQDILELFKTTFTAVRDFWLNLFTGEGLANSLDQAMTTIATAAQEKFNNQMKRNSDLINEVANAYDEAAGNIDLGKESPLTERLRGERDGLARDLAMARLALDQKKEEDKVTGAPQPDGGGGEQPAGMAAGMSGFADFGKKLQEQALKQDDKNQKAIISGIKEGNALQRQQLEVAKDTRTKISQPGVGTLTGGK